MIFGRFLFVIFTLMTLLFSSEDINFTKQELQYLKEHKSVTFTGDPNWLPFEAFDENGNYIGIVADHLKYLEERLNISFDKEVSKSWTDALNIATKGRADIISGDASDDILNKKFDPIYAYIHNPIVIIMKASHAYVDSVNEIADKKIAIIKDYGYTADIFRLYPHIKFIEVENVQDGLLGVATGEYDAMLASLALASFTITQMALDDVSIVGKTDIMMNVTLFVSKGKPLLHSIINKTMKRMDRTQHQMILNKWRHSSSVVKMDYTLLWWSLTIFALIVLFFFIRQRLLKRYSQRLETLKERMELALLGNNDGLWDWNLIDNSVYFSPRWKEMLGYRDDELVNEFSTWEAHAHPDDKEKVFKAIDDHIMGKSDYIDATHRLKHKDGHWVWVQNRAKAQFDKDGKAVRLSGTHTDITKEKEMQLKYAHQAQIIEQTHDSVISTDLDGNIISWNYGSEVLLEYKADEVIGKHIAMIYLEDEYEILKENIEILQKQGEYHAQVRLVKKSQDIIFADVSLSLLKDEHGIPMGMISYAQDITDKKMAEDALIEQKDILDHQAHHDALTKLPNRLLLNDRLNQGIERAKRNKSELALFFLDLDHFKQINDSLGHDIGDEVLKQISLRLKNTMRKGDTLARLGGDEFVIIVDELNSSQDASKLATKILEALAKPVLIANHTLYVSSSIGISLYPMDGIDAQNLLKYADAAMYKAKDEGRNNFQFYSSEMTELAFERVVMEASLRQALKNKEFVVYYQPQVDVTTETIIGMEALVRWQHPTMGLVPPMKFIPLAEETGLIVEIDQWVMSTAMLQVSKWYEEGLAPGKLALNLAMKQLQQEDLISIVKDKIKSAKFKPEWLELEVTEGQIMHNPDHAIGLLGDIGDLGIKLAIDDFGTGYSSLSYLKKLPIDKLKIDQSFVRDLPDDEDDVGIVQSVIMLSKNLGLEVIAEGVETQEQKTCLIENGCKYIQGYLYGKPMPAEDMQKMLEAVDILGK